VSALDKVRRDMPSDIRRGLAHMGVSSDHIKPIIKKTTELIIGDKSRDFDFDFQFSEYDDDPKQFKQERHTLANVLETYGY